MSNLSNRAARVVYGFSQDEAREFGSSAVLPEHIILAVTKMTDCLGYFVLQKLGINIEEFRDFIKKYIPSSGESPLAADEMIPSHFRIQPFLELAELEARSLKNSYVGTEHLLLAAAREKPCAVHDFCIHNGFEISELRKAVTDVQKERVSSGVNKTSRDLNGTSFSGLFGPSAIEEFANFLTSDMASSEKEPAVENQKGSADKEKSTFLSEFTRNITYLAGSAKIDPVVGREKEIKRLIQILSRRTKNNPVLVGEPGVGKSALVEGLAFHIAGGAVPSFLSQKKILSLDITKMVAGTKYRGEFEERMKKLMKEVSEDKNIILFIDELHTIIGAGGPEGQMDAANMLKPALSRGELQIIGATTTKEYRRYIEKDSALDRRFQKLNVEEPSDADTEEILRGIKPKYEEFHKVRYEDSVIPLIVKLSRRYIQERCLPDKAIDILDEAGAQKKIQAEDLPQELLELQARIRFFTEQKQVFIQKQDYENAARTRDKIVECRRLLEDGIKQHKKCASESLSTVTGQDICRIISDMTGIPLARLDSDELKRLVLMEDELHKTVIGQEEAVHVLSGAIRRSRAGISSPKRPIGSFIFLGPTGVGKTQLAKALAQFLFGNEDNLIRIDMSDFMEKHNASRLVGAPPGYIGYEDGGVLTEQVRRHPYSVVLLDEIEKAHPDVFNLLLQLLEEGELSDNLGHTVNFRNTVILMTSNAGARQISAGSTVGFSSYTEQILPYEDIKTNAVSELKKLLNPELLNRIDDVIVFKPLERAQVARILDIQLKDLSLRLAEKNITLCVTESARTNLTENGYEPSMGARPMRRLIQDKLENPISVAILEQSQTDGAPEHSNTLTVDFDGTEFKVYFEKPETQKEFVAETVDIRPRNAAQ